jgi:hypothetical protein
VPYIRMEHTFRTSIVPACMIVSKLYISCNDNYIPYRQFRKLTWTHPSFSLFSTSYGNYNVNYILRELLLHVVAVCSTSIAISYTERLS